jgi:hypothetical protein
MMCRICRLVRIAVNNLPILLNQVAAEAVHNFALLLIGNFTAWMHVRWTYNFDLLWHQRTETKHGRVLCTTWETGSFLLLLIMWRNQKRPDRLWGPPNLLLFNRVVGIFLWNKSGWTWIWPLHLRLVAWLIVSIVIPSLAHVPSWQAQRQRHFSPIYRLRTWQAPAVK